MPDLQFHIESAGALKFAAAPSLSFKLRIENRTQEPIRSISLDAQIRIASDRRRYSAAEKEKLWEVFGAAENQGASSHSLLFALVSQTIPAFADSTVAELAVPCTYDFDVVSAKYFHNLDSGEVPLDFLFSGSVFHTSEIGLQVVQIPWDREARFSMPVAVWREMMQHYFPNSAWLRVHRDVFNHLYDYKMSKGLPTWDAVLDELLDAARQEA